MSRVRAPQRRGCRRDCEIYFGKFGAKRAPPVETEDLEARTKDDQTKPLKIGGTVATLYRPDDLEEREMYDLEADYESDGDEEVEIDEASGFSAEGAKAGKRKEISKMDKYDT